MKTTRSYKQKTRSSSSRGFTLLELLVVMAIMLVITSLVLARHAQFNGTVLLRNLAYDVALSIRQAQVYGISGRSAAGVTDVQYGVYLSSANPSQYVLFADTNSGGSYTSGTDVELEVYNVRAGYTISNFCGQLANGTTKCRTGGTGGTITSLTIMFKRPDPDARITSDLAGDTYAEATITVLSPTGFSRVVTVTSTGQMSVQQ